MGHAYDHLQGHIDGAFRPRLLPSSGQPGGSAFSPLSLFANGEKGWLYDPSNITTLFQSSAGTTAVAASSDPVGYMADLSGNGWHQLQATSGNRPLYIVDGTKKALRFNGTTARMSAASVSLVGVTKATLVLCLKQNTSTPTSSVIAHGTGPASSTGGLEVFFNNVPNGSVGVGLGNSGGANYLFNSGPAQTVPRRTVVTVVFDPAAAVADDKGAIRLDSQAVNETQVATVGTVSSPFALLDLYLGARASTLFSDMDLYFCALVGRELTAAELSNLEEYAAAKGGLLESASLTPTSFTDTGAASDTGNYYLTSTFSSVDVTTSADAMYVDVYTTIQSAFPTFAEIGVYVDGVFNQRIVSAANGAKRNTIMLPTGSKTVSFVNGLQASPSGTVLGTWVTRIGAPSAMTQTNLTPSNRVLIYGDSIAAGGNATITTQDAWALLVRSAYAPDSIALEAWGYRSLHDDCVDATARGVFVAKVVAYAPATIWLAIGTNDYGLNKWAAASFGTAYAALLDDLHAALPSAVIYCQTPLLRTTETANGSGSTLGDYRTQIGTAVSTRTAYCTLVDGTAIMTTASLADGVHPTTAGHALYAAAVIAELGI